MKKNVLNISDMIISEDYTIHFILNESYSDLIYDVSCYYASLILDIRIGTEVGYSYYNNLIRDFRAGYMDNKNIEVNLKDSINEIKYLSSLILRKTDVDVLEVFYTNTSHKYKEIENELRVYVDFIYYTIATKI